MYPQHIFKGKKMAGQMGGEQVTVQGLKIVLVDTEKNLIGVSGAVPGPRKGIVYIRGMNNGNSTFTKSGAKATTAAKLDKTVFALDVKNHDLLKQAYLAYQANGRENPSRY